MNNLRILIVAEHASLKYGGEAALPLHYFRVLRQRGIETWLVVHQRTQEELESLFEGDRDRLYFITDTVWHRWLWHCSQFVTKRIADFTFGLVLRLLTQFSQRSLAKKIVREKSIDVIHQPILVSPKEPSTMFDMGVPVVMGPLNGGMNYPPGFNRERALVNASILIGRFGASLFNRLIPGKLKATTVLVANQRTKQSLPNGITGKIVELVENGVDLTVWRSPGNRLKGANRDRAINSPSFQPVRYVFLGRLVDWKAVDILLKAFKQSLAQISGELEIIGDGEQRSNLESLARELELNKDDRSLVHFTGFLPQIDCAQRLQSADVLVLPSLYECGGAVVLEAMTMGIPVIATDWGGPQDYLNSSCGILVKPNTPEQFVRDLAAAMTKLAKSPQLRQKMGQAGYQRIVEQFDWEIKIDTMLEIYQEAIARYAEKSQKNLPQTTINHKSSAIT